MLLNIQFQEASDLMWDMFFLLDPTVREAFASRVDRLSSVFSHPNLGGSILCIMSSDSTSQPASTLGCVVLPLQRPEVA